MGSQVNPTQAKKKFKLKVITKWDLMLIELNPKEIEVKGYHQMGSQVNPTQVKKKFGLKRIPKWDLRLTKLKPKRN